MTTANDSADSRGGFLRLFYTGSAGAFAVQVGGAAFGLLVHAIVARLAGAADYGVFALILTWISVLCAPALLGQTTAVARFIPQYVQNGHWGALRGLRRFLSLVVACAAISLSLAGALALYFFYDRFGRSLGLTVLAALVLLPIITQLQLSGALHRGLKRAGSSGAFNNLLRPTVMLIGILGMTHVAKLRLTAPLAMIASTVGAIIALAGSEWSLARAWPATAKTAPLRYEIKSWVRLGGHALLFDSIGILLSRVDVMILGVYASSSIVGPYYAAVQLAAVSAYGLNAVMTVLAPMIAERDDVGDRKGLARAVRHGANLTFAITAILSIAIAVFGRSLLALFGPKFELAYVPLLIVLAGQCVNAATGPTGYLMIMTRFSHVAPLYYGAGALINVVLSIALIPRYGMLGAAIATALSTAAWNIAAVVFIWLRLGINSTVIPMPLAQGRDLPP